MALNHAEGVKFYTVAELATLLRVSKMSVYRIIRGREIDSYTVGGRCYRVTPDALDAYLERQLQCYGP